VKISYLAKIFQARLLSQTLAAENLAARSPESVERNVQKAEREARKSLEAVGHNRTKSRIRDC
jgi:hypothetical protein